MRISISLLLIFFSFIALAQENGTQYSRVKIDLEGKDLGDLARTGIDVYHGQYVRERFLITDLASWEIDLVRSAGFGLDIEIADVQAHYHHQLTSDRRSLDCSLEGFNYKIPKNFKLGSMGGYHTFSEMEEALDAMALAFPDLISVKRQVGELTGEGNKIWWVRISDNPEIDEIEPGILYTALHHAREPLSLSQMLYYMWHLLESYGEDQEITYLVDNTQLFFMPCLNPDGYIYNELTNPEGGGMWRKNKRDNDNDGHFDEQKDGVDLNRNYGFQWAFNDEGSSGTPGSNVYRGPWEFSEPESQSIQDFARDYSFSFVLNFHSFANCLLIPWGFNNVSNPDSLYYAGFAEALTRDNKYKIGNTYQTLGYTANGTATDWFYSETGAYSFAPELGYDSDGFWPATDKIIPYCKSAIHLNLTAARLAHSYADVEETSDPYLSTQSASIILEMKRYGLGHGNFVVELEPLDGRVSMNLDAHFINLSIFDETTLEFPYTLLATPHFGESIDFVIHLNNGIVTFTDTISKIYAGKDILLNDDGLTLDAWDQHSGTEWGITFEEYYSAPSSITDSPHGTYDENSFNVLALAAPIDLTEATDAVLRYVAKWELEELVDYAMVQVSTDGDNYEHLCGRYSKPGSVFQAYDQPIYDGFQSKWVREEIDLSPYLGSLLHLRFVIVSDVFLNLDGMYLDDIEIVLYNEEISSSYSFEHEDFHFRQYPNPTSGFSFFNFDIPGNLAGSVHLSVSNSLGQLMESTLVSQQEDRVQLDVHTYPSGWYAATLVSGGRIIAVRRFLVQ